MNLVADRDIIEAFAVCFQNKSYSLKVMQMGTNKGIMPFGLDNAKQSWNVVI